MTENILGISAFFHDSAVALAQDGQVRFAAQEERYSRLKNDSRFPRSALEDCLRIFNLRGSDLDRVVYYDRPHTKFSRLWEGQLSRAPRGFRSFDALLSRWANIFLPMHDTLRAELGTAFKGEIHCVEHHGAHAAAAFCPSPFQSAAIPTLDLQRLALDQTIA